MEEIWFRLKFYLIRLAYLKKRSRFRRYSLPIILVAIVFALIIFFPIGYFDSIYNHTISFVVITLIVTISAWYGGFGAGIMATVLTAVANYFTLLSVDLPFYYNTGNFVITLLYIMIGVFISIISEARYEAELQKDEFIGLVTHELKNPLSVIKGFAGLSRLFSKKIGNQKIVDFADEIETQSDRMLELINNLLDINKIEVGRFVYKYELFDFEDLVKEIISHQRVIHQKRLITLAGVSKRLIEGDRYRIGQVITNLLTNANKYSPLKSPIEVKIKNNHQQVSLTVKDYGIGIPKSEQPKIFNQYYRTTKTATGRTEGLGLGLYICKSIVDQHRGKIWVKSTEGKGSTFGFSLPVRNSS